MTGKLPKNPFLGFFITMVVLIIIALIVIAIKRPQRFMMTTNHPTTEGKVDTPKTISSAKVDSFENLGGGLYLWKMRYTESNTPITHFYEDVKAWTAKNPKLQIIHTEIERDYLHMYDGGTGDYTAKDLQNKSEPAIVYLTTTTRK
jgi:hypothetical protein